MSRRAHTFMLWSPRIAALVVAAWLSVFALDAFTGRQTLLAGLAAFLLHLVPSLALLGVVYIAWRRPWFGAVVFLGLAATYLATVQRWSWIAAIAGPFLLTGILYAASWRAQRHPAEP